MFDGFGEPASAAQEPEEEEVDEDEVTEREDVRVVGAVRRAEEPGWVGGEQAGDDLLGGGAEGVVGQAPPDVEREQAAVGAGCAPGPANLPAVSQLLRAGNSESQ